jgi:hypothetical protein
MAEAEDEKVVGSVVNAVVSAIERATKDQRKKRVGQ